MMSQVMLRGDHAGSGTLPLPYSLGTPHPTNDRAGGEPRRREGTTRSTGYTLLEVLIGLAILTAVLVPLVRYLAPISDLTELRDLQTAYVILRGEAEAMYAANHLPLSERKAVQGGAEYLVRCTSKRDGVVAAWTLEVLRHDKRIAGLHGLLFVPDTGRGGPYDPSP